ncbi:MAG: hypothetical protein F4Y51_01975 [Cenarchaeum sp. SB0664_bin_35]|nr:hypothetical protein [Cenarchaeum sp. SB0664_bin_35]
MMILSIFLLSVIIPLAAAQDVNITSYIESAEVVMYDDTDVGTATIVHMTSNVDDTRISDALEWDLWDHPRVLGVIFTNADTCVPGVVDEACLIVNVARISKETDIIMVQDGARTVGDQFITRLNDELGISANFHSIFVHFNDEQHIALNVPGGAMMYNTVSVVYTIPHDATVSFYVEFMNTIFPQGIAEGRGFVDAGRILATHEDSFLLFVMDMGDMGPLTQVRVTKPYTDALTDYIDPLEHLGIDALYRSSYFDDGLYPLSSLIRVAISSDTSFIIHNTTSAILAGADGRPDDITKRGWFFDVNTGTLIRGTFLLGESGSASVGQTRINLAVPSATMDATTPETPFNDDTVMDMQDDITTDSLVVVTIVVIAGVAATAFYMKGYRR